MSRAHLVILASALLGACSVGIDPPDPTALVYLAGDTFEMGTRDVDPCGRFYVDECGARTCPTVLPADDVSESERIVHARTVPSFCIDAHEVTLEQYRHCYARGDCPRPLVSNAGDDLPGDDSFIANYWNNPDRYGDHPVVGVSWEGALAYCRFRGGRLPTETEWEFAAKSGGLDYGPTGYVWSDADLAANIDIGCGDFQDQVALGACSRSLRPVMSSPADQTAQGVFDMAANVAEWTSNPWSPLEYCAAEQPGGGSLEAHFEVDVQGRVSAKPNANLLLNSIDECIAVDVSNESYSGQRMRDFQNCIDACGAEPQDVGTCIDTCFSAFDTDSCLAEGVVSVCGRRSDERGQCAPMPWCVPRNATVTAPKFDASNTSTGFVVRGAHFQSTRACETRPTARRGERLGNSRIGFRCVLAPAHERCRAVQP